MNLFSIGPFVFDLRVNADEYQEDSAEDFARKDVIGARKPYESVGGGDEVLRISGKLFPDKLGGAGATDALKQVMHTAAPQLVMRGDGKVLGFYVVTKVSHRGKYLDHQGRPQMIEIDVTCERCDEPSAASAFGSLMSLFG